MTKRNRVPKQTDFHSVLSEIVRSSVKLGHVQPQERWGSNFSHTRLRGQLCVRCSLEVYGARIKGAIVLGLQTAVGVGRRPVGRRPIKHYCLR